MGFSESKIGPTGLTGFLPADEHLHDSHAHLHQQPFPSLFFEVDLFCNFLWNAFCSNLPTSLIQGSSHSISFTEYNLPENAPKCCLSIERPTIRLMARTLHCPGPLHFPELPLGMLGCANR